MEKLV